VSRVTFDIYLPPRLARHNKLVFGVAFVCGDAIFLERWFTVVR
jgi:hypothetical protein